MSKESAAGSEQGQRKSTAAKYRAFLLQKEQSGNPGGSSKKQRTKPIADDGNTPKPTEKK
jgi:hypothetical protein